MTTQVGQRPDIDRVLRDIATNKNPQIRTQAAQMLDQWGYTLPQAAHTALSNKDPKVRAWGAAAFIELADPQAAPILIPLLQDSNRAVKLAAIIALGRSQNPIAIQPLADFLRKKAMRISTDRPFEAAIIAALSSFNSPVAMQAVADYRRKVKRGRILTWSLVGGIIAVAVGTFLVIQLIHGAQAAPFQNSLKEYVADFKTQPGTTAYVKGKIVVVNKSEVKVDDPFFDLPEDIKATKPEEVGTIVWVEYTTRKVGSYTFGSSAYKYTGNVTVIDKASGLIVGRTSFEGSEPPSSKKAGTGDGYGSKPTEAIKNYLVNLPRK